MRLWFPQWTCRVMDVVVVNVHVHCQLGQHNHGKWDGLCWLQRQRLLDCCMSSWWSVRSWDSENFRNCLLHPLAYLLHSGACNLPYIPQLCLLHIMQELRQLQNLFWKSLLYPSQWAGSSVATAWLGPVMTDFGWLSQIEKSSCHWNQVTGANSDLKWSDYDLNCDLRLI